jgi:hypothetical protein
MLSSEKNNNPGEQLVHITMGMSHLKEKDIYLPENATIHQRLKVRHQVFGFIVLDGVVLVY